MKHFIFIVVLILCSCSVFAAFSTPFIANNTLVFNDTDDYNYIITFQNPGETPTVMEFEVIEGMEWVNPTRQSIGVAAQQFDKTFTFIIKVPKTISVTEKDKDGKDIVVDKPFVLEYNKKYPIVYTISSGDAGTGTIPVSSKIKKSIYVQVYKGVPKSYTKYVIYVLVTLLVVGFIIYDQKQQKKKVENKEVPINQ